MPFSPRFFSFFLAAPSMGMGKSPVQKQSMCARCCRVYFMTSATTSAPAPPAIYQLPAREQPAQQHRQQSAVGARTAAHSSIASYYQPALLRQHKTQRSAAASRQHWQRRCAGAQQIVDARISDSERSSPAPFNQLATSKQPTQPAERRTRTSRGALAAYKAQCVVWMGF